MADAPTAAPGPNGNSVRIRTEPSLVVHGHRHYRRPRAGASVLAARRPDVEPRTSGDRASNVPQTAHQTHNPARPTNVCQTSGISGVTRTIVKARSMPAPEKHHRQSEVEAGPGGGTTAEQQRPPRRITPAAIAACDAERSAQTELGAAGRPGAPALQLPQPLRAVDLFLT
jgi:hypothetical protein